MAQQPMTPAPRQFQEVNVFTPSQQGNNTTREISPGGYPLPMGATDRDIHQQVRQKTQNVMGINQPGLTEEQATERAKKHLQEVLYETQSKPRNASKNLTDYERAFGKIDSMLRGKSKMSIQNAYFAVEQAYGNMYLSYNEYKGTYKHSADFIKKYLKQRGIPAIPQNLHLAIQQFMGDTLSVSYLEPDTKKSRTTVHYPFKYDYQDYDGSVDYRNYFSTKCIATGTGQCNSLPIVYLCLAEELGVKAYLSFAPFHSYIKWRAQDGSLQNYEPTSNWSIPDKWYQKSLGVSYRAVSTGIYLDTLGKRQVVANCLVDLAVEYLDRNQIPDSLFVQKCLETAEKYYPKKNNLTVYLVRSKLLSMQLDKELRQRGKTTLSGAETDPVTNSLYQRLLSNEYDLVQMGYEQLPQQVYDQLLQQQANHTVDPSAKTKKTLFMTQ